jgi:hypothetical protein
MNNKSLALLLVVACVVFFLGFGTELFTVSAPHTDDAKAIDASSGNSAVLSPTPSAAGAPHRTPMPSLPALSSGKPRIGVLLAWWPLKWFLDKPKEEQRLVMANRECYCHMHNYTLFVGSDIEVPHGYWAKLVHARRIVKEFKLDWLFFGDVDFLITDFSRSLESFIPDSGDYHLVLPQDNDGYRRFSNFNFLVKNSEAGRHFLDLWAEEMESGCNPAWPDQVAMWRAILRFLDPYTGNKTDCPQPPNYCCRYCRLVHPDGGANQSLCFEEKMNQMGCGAGHVCPPVYFTRHDAGLGLQAGMDRWTEGVEQQVRNSLGIHCKPQHLLCRAYARTFVQHANGTCAAPLWLARPPSSRGHTTHG